VRGVAEFAWYVVTAQGGVPTARHTARPFSENRVGSKKNVDGISDGAIGQCSFGSFLGYLVHFVFPFVCTYVSELTGIPKDDGRTLN
jgi:hypothetical protein